jgi:serine/threonine-protein kinase HipA
MNKLNVFYETLKVGEFRRDEQLVTSFQYSDEWLESSNRFPLSFALPLQKEPFPNKTTLSFFENLLPEGDVRKVIGQDRQIESPYEFLKEFGQDCAGAIIVSSAQSSPYHKSSHREMVPVPINQIYSAIEKHHSVAHEIAKLNPGYLSLAGAQDKFPAIYENDKFYLPKTGGPTTHIVKVPIVREGVRESVYNEYYCMQLAASIGFKIPYCEVVETGKYPLYVIERYDRHKDNLGMVHRIHQQDFCQAMGITSEFKYEAKGGPTIKDNYDLIVKCVGIHQRKESVYAFFDWICFNLLIKNNDSHSKNISLLMNEGRIELAPFYDLLCTGIYSSLKRQFSFSIGGSDELSRIGRKQFELLDQELGLKIGTFEERMKKVVQKTMEMKDQLAQDIVDRYPQAKIQKRISKLIGDQVKSLKQQGVRI